jgi:hypothetical protein
LTNLLEETLECLADNKLSPSDVLWVGMLDGAKSVAATWAEFEPIAAGVNYDSGYGCNEIPEGLVVVGSDWWLSRGEYDGSEWWDFNRKPERPVTLIGATLKLGYAA